MAPTRGKLGRGKTAGRGLGYLDGTLATAFHEVAFRLHLQEDLENQAGHAILAFLRGNAVRRATPDLAPTRHRIYERTRRKLADAGRHQAATKIQSKFKVIAPPPPHAACAYTVLLIDLAISPVCRVVIHPRQEH